MGHEAFSMAAGMRGVKSRVERKLKRRVSTRERIFDQEI